MTRLDTIEKTRALLRYRPAPKMDDTVTIVHVPSARGGFKMTLAGVVNQGYIEQAARQALALEKLPIDDLPKMKSQFGRLQGQKMVKVTTPDHESLRIAAKRGAKAQKKQLTTG